uniref:(northern house mosquito) hypothetical protein n=1 Tax=Culex pipiens TaxID=7175 RepID=A0A8D8MNL6_CULPI
MFNEWKLIRDLHQKYGHRFYHQRHLALRHHLLFALQMQCLPLLRHRFSLEIHIYHPKLCQFCKRCRLLCRDRNVTLSVSRNISMIHGIVLKQPNWKWFMRQITKRKLQCNVKGPGLGQDQETVRFFPSQYGTDQRSKVHHHPIVTARIKNAKKIMKCHKFNGKRRAIKFINPRN